jgi:catechol 2,3-dioxygenase-like lactoylglutathione lyase family enzyme
MMPLKIDHITLLVSSLETSMPYYQTLLTLIGYKKLRDHVWTDGDGFFLQFGQAKPETRPYERYGSGMNHVGFSAPSETFVKEFREQMIEAGFNTPEIQDIRCSKCLFMRDNDGIRFEISYYPPGADVVD